MNRATTSRDVADALIPLRALRRDGGQTRLGLLLFLLLLVAGVWAGFKIIPFYYYYNEIQGLMDAQAAKASLFSDEKIRKELLKRIRKLEIPINDPEDLKINRFDGKIVIDLKYEEVLYIDLGEDRVYDLWIFKFNPHVERQY